MTLSHEVLSGLRDRIEPCPFCGGEGLIFQLKMAPKMWRVECKNCDAGPSASLSATHAVEKWNRRVPSSELLELREAVKPFAAAMDAYEKHCRDEMDWVPPPERYDDEYVEMLAITGNYVKLFKLADLRAARSLQSHTGEA